MWKIRPAIILFLAASCYLPAHAQEQLVQSRIDKATVYREMARVERVAELKVPAGVSHVIMSGISPQILPTGIIATAGGQFQVLDARHEVVFRDPGKGKAGEGIVELTKDIQRVTDSLTWLDYEIDDSKDKLGILQREQDYLLAHQSPEMVFKSLEDVPEFLDYSRKRLEAIRLERMGVSKRLDRLEARKLHLERRLSILDEELQSLQCERHPGKVPVQRIVITVSAAKQVKGKIRVSYLVKSAGWDPLYSFSTDNGNGLKLSVTGIVWQLTGEPWEQVEMDLSEMTPFTGLGTCQMHGNPGDSLPSPPASINRTYRVSKRVSVASDEEPSWFLVSESTVPSEITYIALPRLQGQAMARAALPTWRAMNLGEGMVSVATPRSQSGRNPAGFDHGADTLMLDLGPDGEVLIDFSRVKDQLDANPGAGRESRFIVEEFVIHNNKKVPIDVKVLDRVIPAGAEDVSFEEVDVSGATFDAASGMLTWELTVTAGDSRRVRYSYRLTRVISE